MEHWVISNGQVGKYNTDIRPLYIYQRMRTKGNKIIYLPDHLKLINYGYEVLYGAPTPLTIEQIQRDCHTLLKQGGYSENATHIVELRYDSCDNYSLRVVETSLYKSFSVRAVRPKAHLCNIANLELNLPTSIAITANEMFCNMARRYNCDIPLCIDECGMVASIDGASPIIVKGKEIIFSRTVESVELDMVIQAMAEQNKYQITTSQIALEELINADELLYIDYRGVTAVGSFSESTYSDNIAHAIIRALNYKVQ